MRAVPRDHEGLIALFCLVAQALTPDPYFHCISEQAFPSEAGQSEQDRKADMMEPTKGKIDLILERAGS